MNQLISSIMAKAEEFGASLAGFTTIASLQDSPSHKIYGSIEWPEGAKSVLVLALVHNPSEPHLDWWDDRPGGTPGNRQLISISKRLKKCLNKEFSIKAWPLPYHVEKGGIFLKDAAVLAGLGTMGKNNLLITREFGPRIRLRAILLDADLQPTGPMDFTPCESCRMPCRNACPQDAFKNGSYSRVLCDRQMRTDEVDRVSIEALKEKDSPGICVKYCRACEMACPVEQL